MFILLSNLSLAFQFAYKMRYSKYSLWYGENQQEIVNLGERPQRKRMTGVVCPMACADLIRLPQPLHESKKRRKNGCVYLLCRAHKRNALSPRQIGNRMVDPFQHCFICFVKTLAKPDKPHQFSISPKALKSLNVVRRRFCYIDYRISSANVGLLKYCQLSALSFIVFMDEISIRLMAPQLFRSGLYVCSSI